METQTIDDEGQASPVSFGHTMHGVNAAEKTCQISMDHIALEDLVVEDAGTTVNESRELSLQDWRNSRYGAGFNPGSFDADDDH